VRKRRTRAQLVCHAAATEVWVERVRGEVLQTALRRVCLTIVGAGVTAWARMRLAWRRIFVW